MGTKNADPVKQGPKVQFFQMFGTIKFNYLTVLA